MSGGRSVEALRLRGDCLVSFWSLVKDLEGRYVVSVSRHFVVCSLIDHSFFALENEAAMI